MALNATEIEALLENYTPVVISWGGNFFAAVIILAVGLWLSGWAHRLIARLLARTGRVDDTLTGFLGSLARYLVIAITALAILGRFGVQTASLVALLGAFGLAVGLALQGTLADIAAGVMLLFFRPFKAGDYVDAGGIAGTVKAITLFNVELATPDNRKIIVPNGKIWGNPITNFSANATRRVDVTFGIAYEDDIDKAMEVIRQYLAEDERALSDPEAQVVVTALADSAVNITARVWVATADYWALHAALLKGVKERFDAAGITIPYPHVYQLNKNLD
ncbi:MAG: mechanosensitive ion channel family protein [Pseudomonadota bacterium]